MTRRFRNENGHIDVPQVYEYQHSLATTKITDETLHKSHLN